MPNGGELQPLVFAGSSSRQASATVPASRWSAALL